MKSETGNWKSARAKRLGALAAGALIGASITLGAAMPANATVVYYTYKGIVALGSFTDGVHTTTEDTTGLFGGGDLGGTPYTATFVFNIDPAIGYVFDQNSTGIQIFGGSASSTPSPLVFNGASVTLGTTTVTIDGAFQSALQTQNEGGATGQTVSYAFASEGTTIENRTGLFQQVFNNKGAAGFPLDPVQTDYFYSFDSTDVADGALETPLGIIYLKPTSLRISTTAPVVETPIGETPLPAALPLFATGLGALGLIAHRRKRKAKV